MSNFGRMLVVDDEESVRNVVAEVLKDEGFEVTAVSSGEKALEVFRKDPFPFVITDIRMEGMSGVDLLQEIKKLRPDTEVVIMTSHASLDTAIQAIRAGAYDYLTKPFEDLQLISTVMARAVEKISLVSQNRELLERLRLNNEELARFNKLLKEIAIHDGLTGLYNHRFFYEALMTEVVRSHRHKRFFSLIFTDVDFFKKYNDKHGHPEGDNILKNLAKIFQERLRSTDVVARYGGEEFVMILPETSKEKARQVAEKIRKAVADYPFKGRETQPLGKVTISLGVSTFPEDGKDGNALVQNADQLLYEAKKKGRNTVC